MKNPPPTYSTVLVWRKPNDHLLIQAPLPNFNNTLPILITIPGQGSGRQDPPPSAPPEQPAND